MRFVITTNWHLAIIYALQQINTCYTKPAIGVYQTILLPVVFEERKYRICCFDLLENKDATVHTYFDNSTCKVSHDLCSSFPCFHICFLFGRLLCSCDSSPSHLLFSKICVKLSTSECLHQVIHLLPTALRGFPFYVYKES